ncbi:MAG: NAD(P)(+) transhydrogenase (Re/Si-specific) subunit beta, partial [Melioribacter sp.]|nr:NAD(P)(+) transhydrogenase (Re/Si-specific) subunit beta [Melioribacter sp.]
MKSLASPKTARKGNFLAALGMFIAIVVTLLDQHVLTYEWILLGFVIGAFAGTWMALKVPMTGMPQMVGLLNGFGGGASMLVAFSEYYKIINFPQFTHDYQTSITIVLSVLIGAVTFTGSLIAFGKLQGLVTGKVVRYPMQHPLNALLLIAVFVGGVYFVLNPSFQWLIISIGIISLLLGVLLVLPIGGADMPVAISLLNSYSGLAASATGFVLQNNELIIAGALVGASGII